MATGVGDAMVSWLTSSAATEQVAADGRVPVADRPWVLSSAVACAQGYAESRAPADDAEALARELLDLKASFVGPRLAGLTWLSSDEALRALDRFEETYAGIDPARVQDGAERRIETLMANRITPFRGDFNAPATGRTNLRRAAYDDLRSRERVRRALSREGGREDAGPEPEPHTTWHDPVGTHSRVRQLGAVDPALDDVAEPLSADDRESATLEVELTDALVRELVAEVVGGALAELQRRPLRRDHRDRRAREVGFVLAKVAQLMGWFEGPLDAEQARNWAAFRGVDEAWFFDPTASDGDVEQRRAQIAKAKYLHRSIAQIAQRHEEAER